MVRVIPGYRRMKRWGVGAVLLFGSFALRLTRLGADGVSLDESLSWHFARELSIHEILFVLPKFDPHPPLYYLILHYWVDIAGTSPISLRLPSVLFGTGTVIAIYGLLLRTTDDNTAILGGALVAAASFQVTHAQTARMYALLTFLTAASMYAFVATVEDRSVRATSGYIVSTVLLGYTHVYGLFIVGAQVLYLLQRSRREEISLRRLTRRWGPVYAIIGVALLPWVVVLLERALDPRSSTSIDWLEPPGLLALLETFVEWVSVRLDPALAVLLPVVGLAVTGFLLAFAKQRDLVESSVLQQLSVEPEWMRADDHSDLFLL